MADRLIAVEQVGHAQVHDLKQAPEIYLASIAIRDEAISRADHRAWSGDQFLELEEAPETSV